MFFGGEYALGRADRVLVQLKAKNGAPLGIELVLTRDFFGKDGEVFVRLARTLEDTRLEAGTQFRW